MNPFILSGKYYHCCSSTRIALALNNLKRFKYLNYLPCSPFFRKSLFIVNKQHVFLFNQKTSILFKILHFPFFSVRLYLNKEKKLDERKEKEVSIIVFYYLSLQIKNTLICWKCFFPLTKM